MHATTGLFILHITNEYNMFAVCSNSIFNNYKGFATLCIMHTYTVYFAKSLPGFVYTYI